MIQGRKFGEVDMGRQLLVVISAVGIAVALWSEAVAGLTVRKGGEQRNGHQEVIRYYTGVIEFGGESKADLGNAFYQRGNAYYYLGILEKAIDDYSRALVLSPGHAETFYNRANSYADLGDHDRAIEDYTQAIGLKPDFDSAYYNRANSHLCKGQLLRAVEDYKKAYSLRPDEPLYRDRIEELGLAE
jgi:tetratricopeptide (TPR) repeat protein